MRLIAGRGLPKFKIIKLIVATFLFQATLFSVQPMLPVAQAAGGLSSCSGSATDLTIAASHGTSIYVDLKSSPRLDASYLGYRITSSSARTNVWVTITNFSAASGSSLISLANDKDEAQQINSISAGGTSTAYFLIKASAESTVDQSHLVKVYSGDPRGTDATLLRTCTFTFDAVVATIKAAANKVNSISVSNSSPILGELLTITVVGDQGVIGNGNNSGDKSIIWVTPSAFSSWPTRALRLETVTLKVGRRGESSCTNPSAGDLFTNQLLIDDTTLGNNTYDGCSYQAVYSFRVIGSAGSAVKIAPVAQISSGTQYKHTDLGASASANLNLSGVTPQFTVSKSTPTISGLTSVAGSSIVSPSNKPYSVDTSKEYLEVPYRVSITSSSSTESTLDEIVDEVPSGVFIKSATFTDKTRTTSTSITAITKSASPGKLFFTGPFKVDSSNPVVLNYTMYVPRDGQTYTNKAYGYAGDVVIGSSSSSIGGVAVTTNASTTSIETQTVSVALAVTLNTQPASDVAKTTATINGIVDVNGATTSIFFDYGTNANLTGATSLNASPASLSGTDPQNVSAALTGLTAATTYYFRVKTSSANGDILSFTTADNTFLEITTTSLASGTVGSSYSQTLAFSGPSITYSNKWSILSGTLPAGLSLNASTGAITGTPTTAGSSTITFQVADGNTDEACTSSCATQTASKELTITISNVLPTATTNSASSIAQTSAVLNGAFTTGGISTSINYIYGTDAELDSGLETTTATSPASFTSNGSQSLSVSDLTANTTYYFRIRATSSAGTANGSILSFTTLALAAQTITFTSPGNQGLGSFTTSATSSSGLPVTITASGAGCSGSGVSTAGSSVTFTSSSAGTDNCTLTASQAGNGTYSAATNVVNTISILNVASYTITYSANSATSGNPPASTSGNGSVSLRTNTGNLERSGYTFGGWNENSGGTGTNYAENDPFNLTADITLYAKWTANTLTVTYDSQGGTSYNSTTTTTGGSVSASPGTPTRAGYTFNGWFAASSGGTAITFSYAHGRTANFTLYAQWTANTLTVTYDSQGGTSYNSTTTTTGGSISSSPGTPTRSGYTFNGWFVASSGGSAITFAYAHGQTADFTLYAQWTANSSGGGGGGGSPAPEPIVIPKPVITSLSRSLICTTGFQVNVLGTGLSGGTAKLDGVEVPVVSNNGLTAVVNLPASAAGKKTLEFTTTGGTASIDLTYQKFENPVFAETYMPYMYQGGVFALLYSATDTKSYRLVGNLPEGLSFNPVTGSISGSPLVEGVFSFSMFAVGDCGETEEKITLDIDKAVPKAISHRIYFTRNNSVMPPSVKENLERFLNKVKEMSPRYITPQIYITTNTEPNEEETKATQLERDRYQAICEGLIGENVDAEIILDVFSGDDNMIEIIAYWPNPS